MQEEEYTCPVCGETVVIDQPYYDKHDLDGKCIKCYKDSQGK